MGYWEYPLAAFVIILLVVGWYVCKHDTGRLVQGVTVEHLGRVIFEETYRQRNPNAQPSEGKWKDILPYHQDSYRQIAIIAMRELGYLPKKQERWL
jgi:hypothetical protein